MPFKRRKEGKTNYRRRLKLLKSGSSRLVVRKSLKYITAQVVDFDRHGDKTIATANSRQLKKMGWEFACDNLPAAYLTGLLIGKNCLGKNINDVILDSGVYNSVKGSRIYAVAKGAKDAGINISIDDGALPSEDRIKGVHIASNEKFKSLPLEFEKIKVKILGG